MNFIAGTGTQLLLIIIIVVVSSGFGAGSPVTGSSRNVSIPPIIVVSFDGFRYNYLERINASNLDALAASGVRVPYLRNQFVTKTFPNHQSIATGLFLESHGVTDNSFFDPLLNRTLGVRDNEAFWRFSDEVVPLWTVNELSGGGRRSGAMMWPGSNVGYGPNKTLPSHYVAWNESIGWQWRVDTVMDWLTDPLDPVNLVFMYFEDPDEIAHAFSPESKETTQQIQRVDNITGYIVSKLKEHGLFETSNLIILSDHGFQEVTEERIINITSVVDKSLYHLYSSTPVIHLEPVQEKDFDTVYNAMKSFSQNSHFSVYSKDELPKQWHYKNNRRVMPIVLVADLGYAFDDFYSSIEYYKTKFNFTGNNSRAYGVHGYDNSEVNMHAFFLAHGPAFKSGEEAEPFDNVDIFPMLCLLLGIQAPPNNGSLPHINILKLSRSMGFGFQSPVAWVLGAAVLVGVTILFGILSMMVVKRRGQSSVLVHENGYRYVNEADFVHLTDGSVQAAYQVQPMSKTENNKDHRHNIFESRDTDEIQALLLSSSNEEL